MKIGIISDVHANLYALMEVYSILEKEEVNIIICLGDIVGYGPHPNEVVNFIRRKQILTLKGVYDLAVINNDFSLINEGTVNNFSLEFTRNELTKNNLYYLHNLLTEVNFKFGDLNLKFVHRGKHDDLVDFKEDILVYGYTHVPEERKISKNKYILNPGSLGKPNNGNNFVTFGVLEVSEKIYKFNILNTTYSFCKIQKDMRMLNFPEILINSYEI